MVVGLARCMGTNDYALTCIVCIWNVRYIGEPLTGQTGPCEGVGDDGVIEERGVFLPDFVLLVYSLVILNGVKVV